MKKLISTLLVAGGLNFYHPIPVANATMDEFREQQKLAREIKSIEDYMQEYSESHAECEIEKNNYYNILRTINLRNLPGKKLWKFSKNLESFKSEKCEWANYLEGKIDYYFMLIPERNKFQHNGIGLIEYWEITKATAKNDLDFVWNEIEKGNL